MSRRTRIAVVSAVAAVVMVAAILLVLRPWDTAPAVQTEALGVWREQTTSDPIEMTVGARDPAADGTPQFWVDLPASSDLPRPAHLQGDTIVVSDKSTGDVVWRIAYGKGADVLLLTTPDGSRRHILRRVSR